MLYCSTGGTDLAEFNESNDMLDDMMEPFRLLVSVRIHFLVVPATESTR